MRGKGSGIKRIKNWEYTWTFILSRHRRQFKRNTSEIGKGLCPIKLHPTVFSPGLCKGFFGMCLFFPLMSSEQLFPEHRRGWEIVFVISGKEFSFVVWKQEARALNGVLLLIQHQTPWVPDQTSDFCPEKRGSDLLKHLFPKFRDSNLLTYMLKSNISVFCLYP